MGEITLQMPNLKRQRKDYIYKTQPHRQRVGVKLDGVLVGSICNSSQGFYYVPKNQSKGGEFFPTLDECLNSLKD